MCCFMNSKKVNFTGTAQTEEEWLHYAGFDDDNDDASKSNKTRQVEHEES